MKNFALIGAAGYIAPRHLKAMKATGNSLSVAMDVNDSVGIMDSYFPHAEFFTDFNEFTYYIDQQNTGENKIDYVVVCSPNHFHLPHMEFALRRGIDVICEKPLVLCSDDLDTLSKLEGKYSAKVSSILQLRLHPSIIALKEKVDNEPRDHIFDVDLTYITSRGKWYLKSWKGVEKKSGGIAANIGVHFYDMLNFIFGEVRHNEVHFKNEKTACGYLEYKRARVKWFLSIDACNLPQKATSSRQLTYRSVSIGNEELEFSSGFTDLHIQSYQSILAGNGFGIDENRASIETIESIRGMETVDPGDKAHIALGKITEYQRQ